MRESARSRQPCCIDVCADWYDLPLAATGMSGSSRTRHLLDGQSGAVRAQLRAESLGRSPAPVPSHDACGDGHRPSSLPSNAVRHNPSGARVTHPPR